MKKAGASNHDKVRIKKMVEQGQTDEQISMLTSVRIEHVRVIRKQIVTGTLRIMGPRGLTKLPSGNKTDYVQAEVGNEERVEQLTAAHEVKTHAEQEQEATARMLAEKEEEKKRLASENASKDSEIERLKAELAAAKEKPKKKPGRKKAAPRKKAAAATEAA